MVTYRLDGLVLIAKIRCDGCCAYGDFEVSVIEKISVSESSQLRQMAQGAGWTHFLPLGQSGARDLCPKCFTLPPEG
jgi:hypothetical protein